MGDALAAIQTENHWMCEACGLLVGLSTHQCPRCDHDFIGLKRKSLSMSLSFSMTALVLYLPANVLPFMSMELYGVRNSATIWQGVVQLAESGAWLIAFIVFAASILVPLLKLGILFYVALKSRTDADRVRKTKLAKVVEELGRWSMLDIYLLAVLVAIMKLGPWTTVEPGPGAVLFALVVVFTMLASHTFHSRLLWKGHDDGPQPMEQV